MSGVDFVGKFAGLVEVLEENDVTGSMETLNEACGAGGNSVGVPAKKTVPRGWSLAENGRVEAPDGKTYKNRRIALREMIISGLFSRAEVDLMRSCLKFEGGTWTLTSGQSSPHLPQTFSKDDSLVKA